MAAKQTDIASGLNDQRRRVFICGPGAPELIECGITSIRSQDETLAFSLALSLIVFSAWLISRAEPHLYSSTLCAGAALFIILRLRTMRYNQTVPQPLRPGFVARIRAANNLAEGRKGTLALLMKAAYELLVPFVCMACIYSALQLFLSWKFSVGVQSTLRQVELLAARLQTPPWSYLLKPNKWHVALSFAVLAVLGTLAPALPFDSALPLWKRASKITKRLTAVLTFIASLTFFGTVDGTLVRLRLADLNHRGVQIRASYSDARQTVEKALVKQAAALVVLKVKPHVEQVETERSRYDLLADDQIRQILTNVSRSAPVHPGRAGSKSPDTPPQGAPPSQKNAAAPEESEDDVPADWSYARADSVTRDVNQSVDDQLSGTYKQAVDSVADAAYGTFSSAAIDTLKTSSDPHDVLIGYMIEPLLNALPLQWVKQQAHDIASNVVAGTASLPAALSDLGQRLESALAGSPVTQVHTYAEDVRTQIDREGQKAEKAEAKKPRSPLTFNEEGPFPPGWTVSRNPAVRPDTLFLHDMFGVPRAIIHESPDRTTWTLRYRDGTNRTIERPLGIEIGQCGCEP